MVQAVLHAAGAVSVSGASRAMEPSPDNCATLTALPPDDRPIAQASPMRSAAVVPVARTWLARTPM
jgi:hypothetical protein